MRLLLDEMHSPAVADLLRAEGVDVDAAADRADLLGTADVDLLAAAAGEGRVLVTENVKDFAAIDQRWAAVDRLHAGLVFTHPERFPRGAGNHAAVLAEALAAFVADQAGALQDVPAFVWWLDRA